MMLYYESSSFFRSKIEHTSSNKAEMIKKTILGILSKKTSVFENVKVDSNTKCKNERVTQRIQLIFFYRQTHFFYNILNYFLKARREKIVIWKAKL